MKIKLSGIETTNYYFYWFDTIKQPENRFLGYECPKIAAENHYMLCFWWFCVAFNTKR